MNTTLNGSTAKSTAKSAAAKPLRAKRTKVAAAVAPTPKGVKAAFAQYYKDAGVAATKLFDQLGVPQSRRGILAVVLGTVTLLGSCIGVAFLANMAMAATVAATSSMFLGIISAVIIGLAGAYAAYKASIAVERFVKRPDSSIAAAGSAIGSTIKGWFTRSATKAVQVKRTAQHAVRQSNAKTMAKIHAATAPAAVQ